MSKSYFTLAFLLNLLLIVPLFEAFENPLDDLEKLEEKFGLKKHRNGTGRNDENYITLSSDGPVTFDATISFKATVFAPNKQPPFYYSWSKSNFFFLNICVNYYMHILCLSLNLLIYQSLLMLQLELALKSQCLL